MELSEMSDDLRKLMNAKKIRLIGEALLAVTGIVAIVGFITFVIGREQLSLTVWGTVLPVIFLFNGIYSIVFSKYFEHSGRRTLSGIVFILGALFLWSVPLID